jgi:hypothetical protein
MSRVLEQQTIKSGTRVEPSIGAEADTNRSGS